MLSNSVYSQLDDIQKNKVEILRTKSSKFDFDIDINENKFMLNNQSI